MTAAPAPATETDVCLDLLAIIDDAPAGRLVGSESTTIELVGPGIKDTIIVQLSNGQQFRLTVREVQS